MPPLGFFATVVSGSYQMPDPATILQGDLSRIQLPDVLSFLSMIRGSGKLVVRNAHLERTIHWYHDNPDWWQSVMVTEETAQTVV